MVTFVFPVLHQPFAKPESVYKSGRIIVFHSGRLQFPAYSYKSGGLLRGLPELLWFLVAKFRDLEYFSPRVSQITALALRIAKAERLTESVRI